jgi:hypothetical protein
LVVNRQFLCSPQAFAGMETVAAVALLLQNSGKAVLFYPVDRQRRSVCRDRVFPNLPEPSENHCA